MGLFTGLSLMLTSQTTAFWQLFITYGVVISMGTSTIYVSVISTISKWFEKNRGLAMGIASSGAGLGPLIITPCATYLIIRLGWRMAYLIVGICVMLVVIPLSFFLKKDPYEIDCRPDGSRATLQRTDKEEQPMPGAYLSMSQVMHTRSFWLFLVVILLFTSNLFLVLAHIIPHATDIGFSAIEAASVLSLVGGVTLIGRILLGSVSDRMSRKSALMVWILLAALAMLWLIWAKTRWMLYVFAFILGLSWGGMGPTLGAFIGEVFGIVKIGAILGFLEIGFGSGAAIGPAIGGYIFDLRDNYMSGFILGILMNLIAMYLVMHIRRETRENYR